MSEQDDLIRHIKDNGWDGPLRLLLDALEPVSPLGAQVMWVCQPVLGAFFPRGVLPHIASALEHPDELARLRQALDADDPPATT